MRRKRSPKHKRNLYKNKRTRLNSTAQCLPLVWLDLSLIIWTIFQCQLCINWWTITTCRAFWFLFWNWNLGLDLTLVEKWKSTRTRNGKKSRSRKDTRWLRQRHKYGCPSTICSWVRRLIASMRLLLLESKISWDLGNTLTKDYLISCRCLAQCSEHWKRCLWWVTMQLERRTHSLFSKCPKSAKKL